MKVYVLEINFPYEGSMVRGVFLSLEGAKQHANTEEKRNIGWKANKTNNFWKEIGGEYDELSITEMEAQP